MSGYIIANPTPFPPGLIFRSKLTILSILLSYLRGTDSQTCMLLIWSLHMFKYLRFSHSTAELYNESAPLKLGKIFCTYLTKQTPITQVSTSGVVLTMLANSTPIKSANVGLLHFCSEVYQMWNVAKDYTRFCKWRCTKCGIEVSMDFVDAVLG